MHNRKYCKWISFMIDQLVRSYIVIGWICEKMWFIKLPTENPFVGTLNAFVTEKGGMGFQWWSPACQKKWRSSPSSPRSPWQQPQDVGKHFHVVHLECGVATAHIFVADFWTFHHKSNRYFLSLSLPAANWGVRRLPKFDFHFSFHFPNVFSWDATSVPVWPQYLNCRPGVSVIEM